MPGFEASVSKGTVKVPVEIHNYWHKKFKRHEITIEDLIAVGVSRANAYIIKNIPLTTDLQLLAPNSC